MLKAPHLTPSVVETRVMVATTSLKLVIGTVGGTPRVPYAVAQRLRTLLDTICAVGHLIAAIDCLLPSPTIFRPAPSSLDKP